MKSLDKIKREIGKIVDRLHVTPEGWAIKGKQISLLPDESDVTEFINNNHRDAFINLILDLMNQRYKGLIEEVIGEDEHGYYNRRWRDGESAEQETRNKLRAEMRLRASTLLGKE
jgi:hypothetical protein